MDLNKKCVIGHLAQDPVSRTTRNGRVVVTFSVATNYVFKTRDGEKKSVAEFNPIVAWGSLGDIAYTYLTKGSRVYVEGRTQTRSWQDKFGNKRSNNELIAENLIMLGGAKKDVKDEEFAKEDEIDLDDIDIDEEK